MACSSNSRNGIFDLPITPGEELQVIDTTEENLVICRNSKGKCKLLAHKISVTVKKKKKKPQSSLSITFVILIFVSTDGYVLIEHLDFK